jgi:two-component system phosphate regulon sensor histidine kinase PhoR
MATDFLDLARLESGRTRFTREPVHLGGLVGECLEIVRPQADADQISLEADIDRTVEPVLGDRARLKQLLLNLLTNAIKYNRPGGRVVVRVRRDDQGLVLSVNDTGKGIPAESLPRVFERFYRVPDLEGKIEGTGLGLAIARHIAESNEGSIRVESEVGKGSTFTVHLPRLPEAPRGAG